MSYFTASHLLIPTTAPPLQCDRFLLLKSRVGFYEYFEAFLDTPTIVTNKSDFSKKRAALLRRLRYLVLLRPSLLRDLAEESMLAEGRAFERCQARSIYICCQGSIRELPFALNLLYV